MYKKLIFLISLVLLLGMTVAPALAVDMNPPPWRCEPGSAVYHWSYDDPPPFDPSPDSFPRLDAPDVWSFCPHPDKMDPDNFFDRAADEVWIWEDPPDSGNWVPGEPGLPVSHYTDNSAMQLWGEYEWVPEYKGRTGVLSSFEMGSWDIYNFWSQPPQPRKDFWIQLTWRPMEVTEEWYECLSADWDPFAIGLDPEEYWVDEETGENMAGGQLPLDPVWWETYTAPADFTAGFYNTTTVGFNWEIEYMPHPDCAEKWYDENEWGDYAWLEQLEPFEIISLGDDWETWKFAFSVEPNPYVEFLGLFPIGEPIGDPYELWGSWLEGPTATWPEGWPPAYDIWMELIDPDGIPDSGDEYEEEWGGVWVESIPEEWDTLWGEYQESWMEQERGASAIAVDEIVFDTICIPEPATVLLLGLGGLALIRRRKRS